MKRLIFVLFVVIINGCTERYPKFVDRFIMVKNTTNKDVFFKRYFDSFVNIDTIKSNDFIYIRYNIVINEQNYSQLPTNIEAQDSIIINFNNERYKFYDRLNVTEPQNIYNVNSYTIKGDSLIYTITQADYENATPF